MGRRFTTPTAAGTGGSWARDKRFDSILESKSAALWQHFLLIFLRTNVIFCTKRAWYRLERVHMPKLVDAGTGGTTRGMGALSYRASLSSMVGSNRSARVQLSRAVASRRIIRHTASRYRCCQTTPSRPAAQLAVMVRSSSLPRRIACTTQASSQSTVVID